MVLYISTKDQKSVTVQLNRGSKIVQKLSETNEFGSQILLPLINKILKNNKMTFKDLTSVEVDIGPGSFTGLRVGAAVAQALGLALNIPVNDKINQPVELRYN